MLPPLGLAMLCEVKRRPQRLCFSDLETHQVAALDNHAAAGGISLLAWVHQIGVEIVRWPIVAFRKGDSLTREHAALFPYRGENGLDA